MAFSSRERTPGPYEAYSSLFALNTADMGLDAEGLARRVWPDELAVGRQVSFWGRDPSMVVGVAADLRDESVTSRTTYAFYVPARQLGAQNGSLLTRAGRDPATVGPTIRDAIWSMDADGPITRIASTEELVSDAVSQQRYRAETSKRRSSRKLHSTERAWIDTTTKIRSTPGGTVRNPRTTPPYWGIQTPRERRRLTVHQPLTVATAARGGGRCSSKGRVA